MAANLDEFKYLCTNKSEMQFSVKKILYDSIPNPNEEGKYYLLIMEASLSSNVNTIFEHIDTEVEKLFLSSCLLKSVLDYPLLITFTDPFPSLEGAIEYIREEFRSQTDFSNTWDEIFGGNAPISYIDYIKSESGLSQQNKGDIIQFYTLYIIFRFYNRFHISLKTPVTDIIIKDQYLCPNSAARSAETHKREDDWRGLIALTTNR